MYDRVVLGKCGTLTGRMWRKVTTAGVEVVEAERSPHGTGQGSKETGSKRGVHTKKRLACDAARVEKVLVGKRLEK